ncbi:MAG: hypothetical protein J6K17_09300 [Oscillospiraceae bacterium]|nr:hypothetical protein [Oscillospiraceae bacterium]
MIENNLKNNFTGLKDAFIYTIQSMAGKRSIDTYLAALSEVTDNVITESEKKNLTYKNGTCTMKYEDGDCINVEFVLNFENEVGNVVKKADRKIAKKTFTTAALKTLQQAGSMSFNIEHP